MEIEHRSSYSDGKVLWVSEFFPLYQIYNSPFSFFLNFSYFWYFEKCLILNGKKILAVFPTIVWLKSSLKMNTYNSLEKLSIVELFENFHRSRIVCILKVQFHLILFIYNYVPPPSNLEEHLPKRVVVISQGGILGNFSIFQLSIM